MLKNIPKELLAVDTSLLCSRTFGRLEHRCGPVTVGAPCIPRVKSTNALIPACGETPGPFSSLYSLNILHSTLPFPASSARSFPCLAPFGHILPSIPSPSLPPARPPSFRKDQWESYLQRLAHSGGPHFHFVPWALTWYYIWLFAHPFSFRGNCWVIIYFLCLGQVSSSCLVGIWWKWIR